MMQKEEPLSLSEFDIVCLGRNLRLENNQTLYAASQSGRPVLVIFVFDKKILTGLPKDDARVSFIYESLMKIDQQLKLEGSSLYIGIGEPTEVISTLLSSNHVHTFHQGRDYEPYTLERDDQIKDICVTHQVNYRNYRDHVIFEPNEVLKKDGTPYHVYTAYKNAWRHKWETDPPVMAQEKSITFLSYHSDFPELDSIGFQKSKISVPSFDLSNAVNYDKTRDYPALEGSTHLGPYLRFGLIGIDSLSREAESLDSTFFNQLIWREFYIQILFHYPHVVQRAFKANYDSIPWSRNEEHFELWKSGRTGYSIVDAGMKQLAKTGTMHNRVRMIAASFLVKNLLIDWRWGEAYFAEKLLDFDLAANNGNWQWVAGTGCDSAPYFRIFNPETQAKKFDPDFKYRHRWLDQDYFENPPAPLVDLKESRQETIRIYENAVKT